MVSASNGADDGSSLFIDAHGTLRGRHVGALNATELRASIHRYLQVSVP